MVEVVTERGGGRGDLENLYMYLANLQEKDWVEFVQEDLVTEEQNISE